MERHSRESRTPSQGLPPRRACSECLRSVPPRIDVLGIGFLYLAPTDPRHLEMYMRHSSCFTQAARLFSPAIEPVSIPYENGKTLPGYFMRAAGAEGPRPTLMIITGGDGTCEELYFCPSRASI
jgi:hypothetical protein